MVNTVTNKCFLLTITFLSIVTFPVWSVDISDESSGPAVAVSTDASLVLTTIEPPSNDGEEINDLGLVFKTNEPVPVFKPKPVPPKTKIDKSPEIYSLHIKSDIKLRWASTIVNSRIANPNENAAEVKFVMVLPENAFIAGFLMDIDGIVYKAYVREKEEAKKEYDDAVAHGISAGHVAINPRDTTRFEVSVNIGKREKIRFELTYEELLERKQGRYQQVITIDPGQVVKDLHAIISIKESRDIVDLKVPEIRNEIKLDDVQGQENKLARIKRLSPKEVEVTFQPTPEEQQAMSEKGVQGQFVVQYDVDRGQDGGDLLVVDGYFVHFLSASSLPVLPKHIVFIIDISGSMYGRRLEQTKQALETILRDLKIEDTFGIITFSDSAQVWDPSTADQPPEPLGIIPYTNPKTPTYEQLKANETINYQKDILNVTPENIEKAIEFVKSLEAGGGTNINYALVLGLVLASTELRPESKPMLIFLTDGQPTVGVTSDRDILRNVRKANENQISVFSLAFGDDADFSMLKKLSLQNAAFGRRIYEASDAGLQMSGFFDEISSPLLSNVSVSYLEDRFDLSSLTKSKFTSLFKGAEIVVAGKLNDDVEEIDPKALPRITGIGKDGQVSLRHTVIIPPEHYPPINITYPTLPKLKPQKQNQTRAQQFVERLWAYLTIRQLLDEIDIQDNEIPSLDEVDTTTSVEEVTEVLIDRVTPVLTPKQKALKLALKYEFVTPLTSLVVVKPNGSEIDTNSGADKHKGSSVANFAAMPLSTRPAFQTFSQHSGLAFASGYAAPPPPPYPLPLIPPAPTRTTTLKYKRPLIRPTSSLSHSSLNPLTISGGSSEEEADLVDAMLPSSHDMTTPILEMVATTEVVLPQKNLTLSDVLWLKEALKDNNSTEVNLNITGSTSTNSSIQQLYVSLNETDTPFELCDIPNQSEPGQCRHLKYCILQEFADDFSEFQENFLCVIDTKYVGACCPASYGG